MRRALASMGQLLTVFGSGTPL
eukprot:COSAG02_NODE_37638_length_439_cov_0.908824_1_plen_21_part_01